MLFQPEITQVKDTIIDGRKSQIIKLSNGELYACQKPKCFNFITKLPRNVAGS